MITIVFLPAAEEEIVEAIDWYSERSPNAARNFLEQLSVSIALVQERPEQFKVIAETASGRPIHRCKVRKFPYGVVYFKLDERVVVLAVPYLGRRPQYWLDRVEDL